MKFGRARQLGVPAADDRQRSPGPPRPRQPRHKVNGVAISSQTFGTGPGALSLMEDCIPALRCYAWTLLRERQEVNDLVHESVVHALDQLHTWRSEGDMRAWLFAIMHNLFVSRLRKAKVRGHAERIELLTDAALMLPPVQDETLHAKDVVRALERLPEEQRTVLILVTVEDLNYAEVAAVLKIPIGTVMSRLARARERLRQITEGEPRIRRVK
jgi:RNA polymerase sigma-70 factor, ECF subfamily